MKKTYLHPTQESGKTFYFNDQKGEIVMLNLIKFKAIADYSKSPVLASEQAISGKEAYSIYMKSTLPFLTAAGGSLLFLGKSADFLIGPIDEKWDTVFLVKHASKEAFLAFAEHPGYLKIAGHRTAAIEDSRLLPMTMVM